MFVVQYLVKNVKNPEKVYNTPEEFWADSVNEDSVAKQHADLEYGVIHSQGGHLTNDKKQLSHWKKFGTEQSFYDWTEARERLPALDKDLAFTIL